MDNVKTSRYFITKTIEDINFCINCLENVSLDQFNDNEILSSAICFKFVQISENVKRLSTAVYEKYPDIPWVKISGLRNRIVHDYGSVQLDIIYNTVKNDLPWLVEEMKKITE
ncbi:MAG: DUF86 domain-containing protein [Clostridia bacterium]|nr:DUF86 domain-containing protein [Clostridia bacterium]